MSEKSSGGGGSSDARASRRDFLKKSGAALAAGVALPSLPAASGAENREESSGEERVTDHSWHRPNLLILITDQERFPQHWPDGWADAHLPNRKRLSDRGLTFTRAFCASSMCTPSRATLFTGLYAPEHKVEQTLRYGTKQSAVEQPTLQPGMYNMAKMLEEAGYDVQYRGKWHISKDPSGTLGVVSQRDLDHYGFHGWEPPDGGTDQSPAVFGGGTTNWDSWYTEKAVEFLENAKAHSGKPFALFVCLINPHDIMSYPGVSVEDGGDGGWDSESFSDIPPFKGTWNYKHVNIDAAPRDQIVLPDNFPQEEFKPAAQPQSTQLWASNLGDFADDDDRRRYLRFYAYLHQESDVQIGRILDALESRPSIYHNTLVIRLADHGEMGLSHGGMRQKAYSAYEETIHVPLVISNPRLFRGPVQTPALASLVDLMPTLATLADVPDRASKTFRGRDLTPILRDAVDHPGQPPRPVQDSVLFTTDENLGSLALGADGKPIVKEPSHIRCLREERWKIVLYFDPAGADGEPPVYELYDLSIDPLEQNNRADPDPRNPYYDPSKLAEMKAKLQAKMEETHTSPS